MSSQQGLNPTFLPPSVNSMLLNQDPCFENTSDCPLAALTSFPPETPLASIAESKWLMCRVLWAQSTGILAAGSGQGHSVPVSTGFSCGQLGLSPQNCAERRGHSTSLGFRDGKDDTEHCGDLLAVQ